MPYVSKEQIDSAKQMDLLTYLQYYEPLELVRFSSNVYTTCTHDSLKISKGKWCWWSREIGGRSALDFLIKVRGMPLPEAVLQIVGQSDITLPVLKSPKTYLEPKKLLLPEPNDNNRRVIAYLTGRGIHREIIDYCIGTGRLYESRDYHNAVFVGFDRKGIPQYATLRGTTGNRFMGEVNGSDKHFSFAITARYECRKLHLFESATDLMSYLTLELFSGRGWMKENHLSLAGIYAPQRNLMESTLPVALQQFIKDYPQIDNIALHLDNDKAGRLATKTIQTILPSCYTVSDEPPKRGKDVNDYLKSVLAIRRLKERE